MFSKNLREKKEGIIFNSKKSGKVEKENSVGWIPMSPPPKGMKIIKKRNSKLQNKNKKKGTKRRGSAEYYYGEGSAKNQTETQRRARDSVSVVEGGLSELAKSDLPMIPLKEEGWTRNSRPRHVSSYSMGSTGYSPPPFFSQLPFSPF